MMQIDRKLAQLFKRVGYRDVNTKRCGQLPLEHMPLDYQTGFVDGAYEGREAQRKADIEVAKRYFMGR